MFDVAIIGAGLAGLTCAQQLHQAGYRVVVIDKSRGVGGRVATRRLHNTLADHGVRYLEPQGRLSQQLIERLVQRRLLQLWTNTIGELNVLQPESNVETQPHSSTVNRYVAPTGMTAVAKFLAIDLEIWLNRRVHTLTPTSEATWHLSFEATAEIPNALTAKAVVVAIPAPQALMLLEPLAETSLPLTVLDKLRAIAFDPCLSVIAGYVTEASNNSPLPTGKACTLNDRDLIWIGLDSSKRSNPDVPVFVLQSTAEFAKHYLDAEDLNPAAQQLLSRAAELLMPWLETPDWFQVHRWRYAFPSRPLNQDCLNAQSELPLVCCGDWCGGNLIEGAMKSGLAAAAKINHQLQQRTLPGEKFLAAI